MCALIPAAGRGVRFGGSENKVFAALLGRPLLGWTLQAFAECDSVDDIVLIGSVDDLARLREIGAAFGGGKVRAVVEGGADRQASVRNGLAACPDAEYVIVHDGARPCVDQEILHGTLVAARIFGAAIAATRVSDTLIRGKDARDDFPALPVSRDFLWAVQTPQVFRRTVLSEAHGKAATENRTATDDAALVRDLGGEVHVVRSSPENLKVTRPEDLALAHAVLLRRMNDDGNGASERSAPTPRANPASAIPSPRPEVASAPQAAMRIGHGYDVHAFASGRPLWLGGVTFPDAPRGLLGHSDADVILHALCDALLGAAGLGDIGILFPPGDERHKDRASIEFLREVRARLDDAGLRVGNVDVTVIAESPKIGPRADEMKRLIAATLGVDTGRIGIKATTNEGMGFVGRGEGIACHASALLFAV